MEQILVVHNPYDRVRNLSTRRVNAQIDSETEKRIVKICTQGPDAVRNRLQELYKEWDIDRILTLNFSALVLSQLLISRKSKKWLWLPMIQTSFLALQATLGWCPPAIVFRKMGFRTQYEIQAEREALLSYLDSIRSLH